MQERTQAIASFFFMEECLSYLPGRLRWYALPAAGACSDCRVKAIGLMTIKPIFAWIWRHNTWWGIGIDVIVADINLLHFSNRINRAASGRHGIGNSWRNDDGGIVRPCIVAVRIVCRSVVVVMVMRLVGRHDDCYACLSAEMMRRIMCPNRIGRTDGYQKHAKCLD